MTPCSCRSLVVVLAVLTALAAATGCSDDRPRPLAVSTTVAGSRAAATPAGVELTGRVTAIELGAPAIAGCPEGEPVPAANCPTTDDAVLGAVTIDAAVILITQTTELETCGASDGAEPIAFESTAVLLDQVIELEADATLVAPPFGPAPGWARATRLFLGSCG